MAPIKKMKTYGRSSKSIVNNSVDAVNVLFAKNKAKTRKNKKKQLIIHELPPRPRGQTLLADDSLHVSLEDTFDKIVKGGIYNVVRVQPQISLVNHSDSEASKSFKQIRRYSPIMTRRRKKSASLMKLSQTTQSNATNKSDSLIPRFKDSTLDKVDSSLEIEKVPNVLLPTSLSYIKLPEPEEISNNLLKPDTSTNRKEISYDPIFTNTFREKPVIHSSTPMVPIRFKEKIVNYTISPIKNLTLPEEPVDILPSGTPIPTKSTRKTHTTAENNDLPQHDWKLEINPRVLLNPYPQDITSCEGFRSLDKVRSQEAHHQFCNAIHGAENTSFNVDSVLPEIKDDSTNSRNSFITLRRRKVTKSNRPNKSKNVSTKNLNLEASNVSAITPSLTRSLDDFNSFIEKANGTKNLTRNLHDFNSFVEEANRSKNLTRSLHDFDSFVEKANKSNNITRSLTEFDSFVEKVRNSENITSQHSENEISSSYRPHALNESESFKTQDSLSPRQAVGNNQESKSHMETPINFVTKRRRRFSDFSLVRSKIQETPESNTSKRRFSLQEPTCLEHSDVILKEAVVMLSKIHFEQDMLLHSNKTTQMEEENGELYHDNLPMCTSLESKDSILREVTDDSDIPERFVMKKLVVNLVKLPLDFRLSSIENETNKYEEDSIPDRSKSLFGNSYVENNTNTSESVNITQANEIDSNNVSMGKCLDLNLSENKKIAERVTNKSIISEYNLREKKSRSFKKQKTVKEKSVNRSLEDTSVQDIMTEDAPRLSKQSVGVDVIKTLEENKCDVTVSKRSSIEIHEFENFFINMTKRTKTPKPKLDDQNKSAVNDVHSNDCTSFTAPNETLENSKPIDHIEANLNVIVDGKLKIKERNDVPCLPVEDIGNTFKTTKKRKSRAVSGKRCYCQTHEYKNSSENVKKRMSRKSGEVLNMKHNMNNDVEETSNPVTLDKETHKDITFNSELTDNTAKLADDITDQETITIKQKSNSKAIITNICFNTFENFFSAATTRPGSSLSQLDDNESVGIEGQQLQNLDESSLLDDSSRLFSPNTFVENVDKNLIVNLAKSPWRKKDTRASCPIEASLKSTLIDLTASDDEDCCRKSLEKFVKMPQAAESSLNQPDSDSFGRSCSSDVIESSVLEPDIIDFDGFRIPSVNSLRRRQSKTLQLKSGKLWRRSLSEHKRSNLVLNVINEDACIMKNGQYCNCQKCKLSRESRCAASRRFSMKIVPATPSINPQRESTILESYAHNASYVSDQILEDNLENSLRSLSLSQRKNSVIQNSAPVTARELVLRKCGQTEPLPFGKCYPDSLLQHCQKIGEGVYGEVFLFRNPNGGTSVMKVIPIEGDLIVNGERQKKFEEILSEIVIAMELSNLRNKKQNTTSGFSETQKIQCIQGSYPEKLRYLWDLYDETRGSENDSPEIFGDDQLYIVLQLANGGRDLEAFIFNNSLQAYTMFQQVACALAVAEEELRFEHRDLHWGNILLTPVDKNKKLNFRLDGKNYEIMTKGVEVAIIDFTLSRIECDGVVIFNDLSLDPDLFTAEGDYQFEIYKLMKKKNGNNWERFEPYTNILWLHYTLDKAINALRYKNVQTKIHKEYISKLKHLKNDILSYNSVKEFVLNNF